MPRNWPSHRASLTRRPCSTRRIKSEPTSAAEWSGISFRSWLCGLTSETTRPARPATACLNSHPPAGRGFRSAGPPTTSSSPSGWSSTQRFTPPSRKPLRKRFPRPPMGVSFEHTGAASAALGGGVLAEQGVVQTRLRVAFHACKLVVLPAGVEKIQLASEGIKIGVVAESAGRRRDGARRAQVVGELVVDISRADHAGPFYLHGGVSITLPSGKTSFFTRRTDLRTSAE